MIIRAISTRQKVARRTGLVIILGLCACSSPRSTSDLPAELRLASARHGLAIVVVDGQDLVIHPFNKEEKRTRSWHHTSGLTVAPDGKTLAWLVYCSGAQPGHEFRLETNTRAVLARLELPCDQYAQLGPISSDARKVALKIAITDAKKIATVNLAYWNVGDPDLRIMGPSEEPDTVMTWSPLGADLAFSTKGQIIVYNLAGKSSRTLATGKDPSWSPDGHWIAYRTPEGEVVLYDTSSSTVRNLGRGAGNRGAMQWSPDSQYLLFAESAPWYKHVLYGRSQCSLMRIRDAATTIVDYGYNDHGGYCGNEQWVYDYRSLFTAYSRPRL